MAAHLLVRIGLGLGARALGGRRGGGGGPGARHGLVSRLPLLSRHRWKNTSRCYSMNISNEHPKTGYVTCTFEVGGQVEDGACPLRDEAAGALAVGLGLLGVLVQVHDRLADARLLQQRLVDGWEL